MRVSIPIGPIYLAENQYRHVYRFTLQFTIIKDVEKGDAYRP